MKKFFKALLIIAAVATGFGAFAIGPLAGIGATISAGGMAGAFATIGAIGTVTAGIGALTGNQKLIKIGGIAAMIGGIGYFASGQGWLGEAAKQSYTAGLTPAAAAVPGGAPVPETGLAQPLTANDGVNTLASDVAQPGLITQPVAPIDTTVSAAPVGTASPVGDLQLPAGSTISPAEKAAGYTVQSHTSAVKAAGGGWLDTLGGYAKDFGTFAKDNPTATAMMMSTVQGAFDTSKEGQNELAKVQAEQLRQQQANVNAVPSMAGFRYQPPPIIQPLTVPQLNAGYRPPVGLIGARG